jgi:DNA helicase-2/ATP-dependent DNA helicase PcrA
MTRAKKELYFTSARDYGGKRARKLSQFVVEALGLAKEEPEVKKSSALEMIERNAPKPAVKPSARRKIEKEAVLNLSYYQIDDYRTCPLKYKYVHILRVPIMQHHTVAYGKAVHDAVQQYHLHKIKGIAFSEKQLLDSFADAWINEGFLSKEHEEERFNNGKKALARFYREQEKSGRTPAMVEKDFTFTLENDCIRGRWDRIDQDGEEAIIVDFKTSEVSKQKDADKRAKESIQLDIYSLAYKEVFGKLPKRAELHFLESGLVGVAQKSEKDLAEIQEVIKDVSEGIRQQDFKARPTYLACRFCAYQLICPYPEKLL